MCGRCEVCPKPRHPAAAAAPAPMPVAADAAPIPLAALLAAGSTKAPPPASPASARTVP